jgi:hypothetical protein
MLFCGGGSIILFPDLALFHSSIFLETDAQSSLGASYTGSGKSRSFFQTRKQEVE